MRSQSSSVFWGAPGAVIGNHGGGKNKSQLHRGDNGNERKELLQEFFIIKRELLFRFSKSGYFFSNAEVAVGQFSPYQV